MAIKIKGNTVLDFGGGSYHTNANVAVVGDSGSIGVGFQALWNVTTGANNTAVGYRAGADILEGSNNVILGAYTGLDAPISQNDSGWIVLSDGQGNIRLVADPSGNVGINNINPQYGVDINATVNIATPTLVVAGSNVLESFESTNNYVQATYLPLAGGTMTGTINATAISANGTVGDSFQVLTSNGNGLYWGPPPDKYLPVNSNTNLVIENRYLADTSNGSITLWLPNTDGVTIGLTVDVVDGGGDKDMYPVTVNANGGMLLGKTQDILLDYNHFMSRFIYNGNTWLVF